jgi:hypothetical protein
MQILEPGSWPLVLALKMGFLFLLFLVAICLILLAHKNRHASKSRVVPLLASALFLLLFVVFNFVNYKRIADEFQNELVGRYIHQETNAFLELDENSRWRSDSPVFKCGQGSWRHVESEDFFYIEFDCNGNPKERVFDFSPNHLTIQGDDSTITFIRNGN